MNAGRTTRASQAPCCLSPPLDGSTQTVARYERIFAKPQINGMQRLWFGSIPDGTRFYRVFIRLYRVLASLMEFVWVLPSFTGFYRVLLGFTGFYWALTSFCRFHRVLLGFNGFLPAFIEFDRVRAGLTEFLPGFDGWQPIERFK